MPFSSGQEISRNIRNGFAKLVQVVLPGTWKAVGFSEGDPVRNICLGLLVLNVVIWVIVLLIHMLKWQELSSLEWCFLVTAASPVVTALIVAFTTVESSERYYFMWIFSMAFAAILSFECLRKGMTVGISAWKALTVITLTTAGIVIGINVHTVYQPILKAEEPTASDALEVVNYLEENGYEMAYSTFENANKMTALSNGKVNVYAEIFSLFYKVGALACTILAIVCMILCLIYHISNKGECWKVNVKGETVYKWVTVFLIGIATIMVS